MTSSQLLTCVTCEWCRSYM